ncbi:SDR family NAD(P)-dependent oxidoreductase [Aquimarina sp. MMG015]|uniref:SDR family NAD(P)-dependent oxidoreductase n=1 Tax=Aquimarina sp. MMG015 TaxID=2822689 RepID=UPI001B3A04CB|nr:SDR family NAD(P)-dependent oxidoreductase [Aquimarina sp. MMG015]MBQ4801418.1 SDR family NAD(P)-dependent oxidoreductase [Aquimarina sp. MMG015]
MKLILITGINKGLGEALFDYLIDDESYRVVGISRRITQKQKELLKNNKFIYVEMDLLNLSNPEEDLKISKLLDDAEEISYINNAATISPINKIGAFQNNEIMELLHLNTFVPIVITNYLFKEVQGKKINIINLSSGAATSPIVGWSLYCASKAANEMFFKTLKEQEQENENVNVVNVDPGVIDSGMQEIIRTIDEKLFPGVNDFIELKKNNKLQTPEAAAIKIINRTKLFRR